MKKGVAWAKNVQDRYLILVDLQVVSGCGGSYLPLLLAGF
jgi:hypothetical protein